MFDDRVHRRDVLRVGCGLLGLPLPAFLGLRQAARAGSRPETRRGHARSCIVLFCWGGMSHLDTWDPKPDAPAEVRGPCRSIATATPGIRLGEWLPRLAHRAGQVAIIRSMHHRAPAHGRAMYWNFTGHPPPQPESAEDHETSRQDRPCLGAVVSCFRVLARGLPGSVQVPYPLVDSVMQGGQNAGWLGVKHDPIILRPSRGKPYGGVSRDLGVPVLTLDGGADRFRLHARRCLAEALAARGALAAPSPAFRAFDHFHQVAADMLLSPAVQAAFDLAREFPRLREAYGDHICGQSVLLARRLTEAGVPVVTVVCAAGDLNGSKGDHWDTHDDNFNRLRGVLLPPLDRASAALLDDLEARGRLDETLVVWLTEFGRTPRINRSAGRDHYPLCYSVALAGGGVRGGQVHGRSDRLGAVPAERPCGPNDLHATIFRALGIPGDAHLQDHLGRPFALTDGQPLPLFG